MVNIHAHKEDLKKIPAMIQSMLNVDVAIFDRDSRLLAATEEYFRQKGQRVHAPSIQEVLANGNVVVNKPGHMAACSGCRFIGNCPAKIEILKRFGTDAGPLGVMALTSFTRNGHDKITRETQTYVDALKLFSDWIADLVSDRDNARAYSESEEMLTSLMDMSGDAMLTMDTRGMVTRGNTAALKLFAFCDLCTRSAFHILPEPLVNKILEGSPVKTARVTINGSEKFLSARPVHSREAFTGAVLTLSGPAGSLGEPEKEGPRTESPARPRIKDILGSTPEMARLKKTASRLSGSSSTILITGETGTGKGLLAQALHHSGPRKNHPFVPVNCTSIPDTLFESELFGYEEGAFTGARKGGKPGRFELAHRGTLFLDEIGEMPLHLQAKLLNVLQDQAFQRVGGVAFIPVDVRVIAATNQDLEKMVKEKKFRADLYYRLNVIPMDLPPLAGRKDDIPQLCTAFINTANARAGRMVKTVSPKALALFQAHTWPGNVRELQNIIEYSVNMARTDTITPEDFPEKFLTRINTKGSTGPGPEEDTDDIRSRAATAQARVIQECLDRYGHDVTGKKKAAEKLGISLRTLYRKLEAMNTAPR
ncbi:MAG: sigma 54-interacting transcriptional regulator [Desulfobacter sp.]|nr:MAG: sigma 54-interacting transcriptional regulator [Desulfobacter sp.]